MNYMTLVVMVSIIHGLWSAIILSYGSIPHSTTLAPIAQIFVFPFGALSLLTSSYMALYSLRQEVGERMKILLVLPQQFFLLLSSYGALRAIATSQFADGIVRPWQFVAVDQVFVVVLAGTYLYFLSQRLRTLS